MCRRGLDEIFGGAAEAYEEMMIVGVDGWTAAGEIWTNGNAIAFGLERPALRVVA
jgi:hypothetical protein